ncbi:MAG: HlyD family efflux transporter periplasmic adaptor subunit [Planctomycetes bacterium]|nr:HlyD family efflux transporter periplasmic adaptor subunit [Planctomycetota bacterium]
MTKRQWIWLAAAVAVGAGAYLAWRGLRPKELPDGFAGSNGRIEAVEIDVATKTAGRLKEVLVNEGDFVVADQVLARMDTDVLVAQLREAEADLRRATIAVETARSNVSQRESEKAAAEAVVTQREAEYDAAKMRYARTQNTVRMGAGSADDLDVDRAAYYRADATVKAARANVAAADAAITTARSQVVEAEASVGAAHARIDRLKADINDCVLRSPRDGRVQYRIAQPGEVLGAGGKVLNMVDLSEVYMTFFLPTEQAGRVQMGAETHLVLDAVPKYVIPARVTFVADVAQFTPKTVETAVERQKLTFRLKAHIDPALLKKYIKFVKTGLPGMAYVQLDPGAEWPERLRVRLPE